VRYYRSVRDAEASSADLYTLHGVQHRVVYDKPKPPDERLMMKLRQRFKPEVVALSEYLHRDLVSLWGYDNVD
jgi:hypothetical protein